MQKQQGLTSSSLAHIEALKAKHKSLSKRIEKEQSSPSVSDYLIGAMKKEKLKLKEEIEGIKKVS